MKNKKDGSISECTIVEPFLWVGLEQKRLNEGRTDRKKIKKVVPI